MKGEVSRINLGKWPVFRDQSLAFLRSLRLVHAMQASEATAIVVTRDDDVFVINDLMDKERPRKQAAPKKIESLCQKKIIAFASRNGHHIVALTDDGKVFTWGENENGQLGNGSIADGYKCDATPKLVGGELADRKVIQVASSNSHVLALTDRGEVFFWGLNYGNGRISAWPERVTHNIGNRKAIAVACTLRSSFVLLDDGKLYSWGTCEFGQLGIGGDHAHANAWDVDLDNWPDMNQAAPVPVHGFCRKTIKQVVCGDMTCMVLTSCGRIYVWGKCFHWFYESPWRFNATLYGLWWPEQFASKFGKAVRIAAHGKACAVEFRDGTVRSWGESVIDGRNSHDSSDLLSSHILRVKKPRTESTIDEAFAPKAMWSVRRTVAETLGLTLNDWRTDDVCFRVDDRQIWAHKQVLRESCHYFERMFKSSEQREYELDHCNYDTFYAFLKYIYTGELGPDTNWVELKNLADYCGHLDLQSLCAERPDEEAEPSKQSSQLNKKERRKKKKKLRKERKRQAE